RAIEEKFSAQAEAFAGSGKEASFEKVSEELEVSKRVNELFDKWQLRVVGKSMLSSGIHATGIRMFMNNKALKDYIQFTSEELAMVQQLGAKLEKEHREMHRQMLSRYARNIFDNLSTTAQKNFRELWGDR
ncbi:MAG: hypothetical protein AAF394_05215, partial [Planctomycetota bacterium]